MYRVQFKKTRLKLSFISECLFSKCSERDRRHEKGSIGEKRGGCTEVFNSNTVKDVLPLTQNKFLDFAVLSKGSICSFICMKTAVKSHQMEMFLKC